MLADVRLFFLAHGGASNWRVHSQIIERRWRDPNKPCAWLVLGLEHLDPECPFTVDVGFAILSLLKHAKILKTRYSFVGNYNGSNPFLADLPLGGQIKILMDDAAKNIEKLQMTADCNGDVHRFWEIVSFITALFRGEHYRSLNKANEICQGQFYDMVSGSLRQLTGVDNLRRVDLLVTSEEQIFLGDMKINFLNIPDTFEENPKDVIVEDSEEDDDE